MDTAPKPATTEEPPPYQEHIGASRQYIRDIILGVNDGLVSTFLLISGVVGGGLTAQQILLAGIAAAIAGAVSMGAGEYMATKSQAEVFEGELALERQHLIHHRPHELDEIREWFGEMGLEGDQLEDLVRTLDADDEALIKVMMALEFGIVESEQRSPYRAMATSALLFLAGSMTSILPFTVVDSPNLGLVLAAVFTGIGLFVVGAVKTAVTRKNPWQSGAENLVIAAGGAVLAYAAGRIYDRLV